VMFLFVLKELLVDLHMRRYLSCNEKYGEFHLSVCQGLRTGFELETLFIYIGAGVSSSMKRYVVDVYSYSCPFVYS
jgi:hypothetical protein